MAGGTRLVGLHLSDEMVSAGASVREAVWELLPSFAVTTAVCVVVTAAAEALNFADVAPDGTVTDVGTVRYELLSLRVTAVLEDGA